MIVLWLLGLISSYTIGGFIHIFLAVAVCVVLVNIIQGRRAGQEALDCFSADRMRGRALLGGIVMLVVGKKRG
jgi:hypothetical protein